MDTKYYKHVINRNRLIRRRRIFFLRRSIFIFLLFILFVLIFVNSSIFNIRNINISGNSILSEEYVLQELSSVFNKNIFFHSIDSDISSLYENRYVENIHFEKKYPNSINLFIDEVDISYYIYSNNEYYIFNQEAELIDILDYKHDFQLIEIIGIDLPNNMKNGDILFPVDTREYSWIKNLSELLNLNNSDIVFDYIDLTNVHSVILGYKNVKIKIGNNDNLRNKLNIAINILNSNQKFKDMVGYIDVRAENYPVISLE